MYVALATNASICFNYEVETLINSTDIVHTSTHSIIKSRYFQTVTRALYSTVGNAIIEHTLLLLSRIAL